MSFVACWNVTVEIRAQVEKEKKLSIVKAWEENEKSKIENK